MWTIPGSLVSWVWTSVARDFLVTDKLCELSGFQDNESGSYELVEVDEEEEKAMSVFMSQDPPTRRTLADVVMEKINDKRTELSTVLSGQLGNMLQCVCVRACGGGVCVCVYLCMCMCVCPSTCLTKKWPLARRGSCVAPSVFYACDPLVSASHVSRVTTVCRVWSLLQAETG